MIFNKKIRILSLLGLLISASPTAFSQQSDIKLQIKPQACIVDKLGESCQLVLHADWQSSMAVDLCLMQQQQQLFCWKQRKQAKFDFNVSLRETTLFSLVDGQQQILASTKLKVSAANNKKYRRRLRPDWSVF
ncbi:DUF3019 domain-containing protein [Psychrobium sp. 1_MG-2023]|uniref:DUF3019 domain-containing protein n=1 Tax=Psychrobium sp. 1_MG-2023 TaxID=3062624 RepID=UPI000C3222D1|nr:DUF3019 domain-containing protein [Psychrobium sp. 1_MG-2023]MDP2561053.1 DUF3019 domain-containing protein [Psychrobium sp. 1_MG-2023]PKF58344.1 hypothetical protein CW748_04065 [Alteromonadales bacterium alter-6D02]